MDSEVFESIVREYEKQREKNINDRDRRVEKVYELVPEIEEIDKNIAAIGSSTLKKILSDPNKKGLKEEMSNKFRVLGQRKKELLEKYNIPSDYDKIKYSCPVCKDTGHIEGAGRCRCFRQKMINSLYVRSNMGDLLKRQNFELFDESYFSKERVNGYNSTPYENMVKIKKFCMDFCDNFEKPSKSLLLYGDTGLGKTYMSSCIAKAVMDKGYTVIYIRAVKLFKLFDEERFGRLSENIDWLYNCDLLIIDDLGTEIKSKNNSPYLLELINERLDNGKKIIINSNNNFDGLEQLYTKRFSSRLMESFDMMFFYGDDIRRQKLFRKESI